ncbi:hypothetical protein MK852_12335 [Shewanella benthica]|uniref:hypothetical protein n=1 Tax=Shewanella benthica TaxID=43661 RepID=UPI0018796D73|nr:hypothetical protein [Shewanella benthica]MBE7214258.1 hypothetical protein [Shewanella benthica]MCL1062916.1 hypothetical protein [Shewanella benthica]
MMVINNKSAIAAPAITGLSNMPVNGNKTPAATGIPKLLYMKEPEQILLGFLRHQAFNLLLVQFHMS